MKYYNPEFDIHDIGPGLSPDNLRAFVEEKGIHYLSIDLWSPHLPEWLKSYDYSKNGFAPIYGNQKVYLFKVLKK
jgi:hypothetical protein